MTAGPPQLWLIGYLAQIYSNRLNRHSPDSRQFWDQDRPLERLGQRQIAPSAGKRRSKLAVGGTRIVAGYGRASTRPGRARLIRPPICAFKASLAALGNCAGAQMEPDLAAPRVGQPRNHRDRPRSRRRWPLRPRTPHRDPSLQPMNFTAAADELRLQEFARLSAAGHGLPAAFARR
jgi:hypothetical protein